eukprot:scaffold357_cov400-Prasinococcus_capsulatus_cf.AAC.13
MALTERLQAAQDRRPSSLQSRVRANELSLGMTTCDEVELQQNCGGRRVGPIIVEVYVLYAAGTVVRQPWHHLPQHTLLARGCGSNERHLRLRHGPVVEEVDTPPQAHCLPGRLADLLIGRLEEGPGCRFTVRGIKGVQHGVSACSIAKQRGGLKVLLVELLLCVLKARRCRRGIPRLGS